MNILLSAYYCDPEGVSEYYVGFKFWRILSERHNVHLLTDSLKKESWLRYLEDKPGLVDNIHFVDLDFVHRRLPRVFNIAYYIYNIKAYFEARRLMKSMNFDIVHHVTASMFRFPVFLGSLGIPFVWGPIGGAVPEPENFRNLFSGDRLDRRMRRLDPLIAKWDPLLHWSMAKAAALLVATPHFFDLLPGDLHQKMRLFTLCGFDGDEATASPETKTPGSADDSLKLLFVGRVVPYKGLQFLLKALARVAGGLSLHLDVLGDGPFMGECRALAQKLGIGGLVDFKGKVAHAKVLEHMRDCDVYVIPSLRESWGISPLEAMSCARPVIGIANGGLDVVLDDECSIRIQPENEEQLVADLAAAVARLAADAGLRRRMGEAGRARVRDLFSWRRVGEELDSLYEDVMRHAARSGGLQRTETRINRQEA